MLQIITDPQFPMSPSDYFGRFELSLLERLVVPSLTQMNLPPRAEEMKTTLQMIFPDVKILFNSDKRCRD